MTSPNGGPTLRWVEWAASRACLFLQCLGGNCDEHWKICGTAVNQGAKKSRAMPGKLTHDYPKISVTFY